VKSKIAALLVAALYRIVNGVLHALAWLLWPRRRPLAAQRVCVFRIGNVGDIACALPAIHAVRDAYPRARLTLLTSPGPRGMPSAIDVLEGVEWVDEIRLYHSEDIDTAAKRWALLKELRARRFDVWIDLPNDLSPIPRQFRDMAFARLAGAKWARGWRVDTLRWAAQAQTEHLAFKNEVDRTLGVVRSAGIPVSRVDFGLPRHPEVVKRVDDALRASSLEGHSLVAIAPGAKRSTNLWEPGRFASVGRQISSGGHAIVLIGDRSEAGIGAQIAAQIGSRVHSFAGEFSVAESCELLRRCSLAICLDSGVQHLASAVGTPCVSLFSFWQMRSKWHPHGVKNVVVQKMVPCHTCLRESCPYDNLCMKAIAVEDVLAPAFDVLVTARAPRAPRYSRAHPNAAG
jgi:ADP-heptose:LPS heptosyltransferase